MAEEIFANEIPWRKMTEEIFATEIPWRKMSEGNIS